MPCCDPSVALQNSDSFVTVTFSPLFGGPDFKVCEYKVRVSAVLYSTFLIIRALSVFGALTCLLVEKQYVSGSFNVFIFQCCLQKMLAFS